METVEQKVNLIQTVTDDLVAVVMTVVILGMAIMQIPIESWLIGFYGTIIAFYFIKK